MSKLPDDAAMPPNTPANPSPKQSDIDRLLATLNRLSGRVPLDFVFDRDEANKR